MTVGLSNDSAHSRISLISALVGTFVRDPVDPVAARVEEREAVLDARADALDRSFLLQLHRLAASARREDLACRVGEAAEAAELALPAGLRQLELLGSFNEPVDQVSWPPGLELLVLGETGLTRGWTGSNGRPL